jgi:hypothetical protein
VVARIVMLALVIVDASIASLNVMVTSVVGEIPLAPLAGVVDDTLGGD